MGLVSVRFDSYWEDWEYYHSMVDDDGVCSVVIIGVTLTLSEMFNQTFDVKNSACLLCVYVCLCIWTCLIAYV